MKKQTHSTDTRNSGIELKKMNNKTHIQLPSVDTDSTLQGGSVKMLLPWLKVCGVCGTTAIVLLSAGYQGLSVASLFWLKLWSQEQAVTYTTWSYGPDLTYSQISDMTSGGYNHTNISQAHASDDQLYLGVYGAIVVTQALVFIVSSLTLYWVTQGAGGKMHGRMLAGLIGLPLEHTKTLPVSSIMTSFSDDLTTVTTRLPQVLHGVVSGGVQVLATLGVICVCAPWVALAGGSVVGLWWVLMYIYAPLRHHVHQMEAFTSVSPCLKQLAHGASTIRSLDQGRRMEAEGGRAVEVCVRAGLVGYTAGSWLTVRLDGLGAMFVLCVACLATMTGDAGGACVGLSVYCALQLSLQLSNLARQHSDVTDSVASMGRVQEYVHLPSEQSKSRQNIPSEWPAEGKVEFQSFGRGGDLGDVSLNVKAGEKIGLVGGDLASLMSLGRAVLGAGHPGCHGNILVDGVNIDNLSLSDLRSRVTYISQTPVLYSGSMRHNLDPHGVHSDADLLAALTLVNLSDLVLSVADGLDWQMGARGGRLSPSQRQLVCVARAVLRGSRLLVVDTGSFGTYTDIVVQEAIRSSFKDSTVITVVNHLNYVMDHDRVAVLEAGTITECGCPDVLLRRPGSALRRMAIENGLLGH